MPDRIAQQIPAVDGIILGPLSTYEYPARADGGINLSAEFRNSLDLYANVRPSKHRFGVPAVAEGIDLVLVRENTEGFYASRSMHRGGGEFMPESDMALAIRKITRSASRRIARMAFSLASKRRGHVTIVHKANVLKISDGLFLEAVREVSQESPEVIVDELLVDAAASLLVRDPTRFDVILTTNMFGDILSNLAAELAGGLGLGPSLNIGEGLAVAQAAHGSAPDIAGLNTANPVALTLSTAMLLRWHGERTDSIVLTDAANELERIIDSALSSPETRTVDIGGYLSTSEFAESVSSQLRSSARSRTAI